MTTETKPEGRSVRELKAIIEADNELWYSLGYAWGFLRDQTKSQLLTIAQAEASEDPDYHKEDAYA